MNVSEKRVTRRNFLRYLSLLAGSVAAAPAIVPAKVLGQQVVSPGNKITLGAIGVGRMGRGDLQEFLEFEDMQVLAVCDADEWRVENAVEQVNRRYAEAGRSTSESCRGYADYRELLAREDIDAVLIATPDHWHALPAIEAAKSGKDIFLQKPLTLTISEGTKVVEAITAHKRILQVGSQQRSDRNFRFACELVRNQRIGELQRIDIGLPGDPGTTPQPVMPVPDALHYDRWLGQAPWNPYTEKRVHPHNGYSRPGWLRLQDYTAGMITGWGAHHLDIARWAMEDFEEGTIRVYGHADFPENGLWNVHGEFSLDYLFPNGVRMTVASNTVNKQGVEFHGSEGRVYVRRGYFETDPHNLSDTVIRPGEIHLHKSNSHKRDFVQSIRSRRDPVAPVSEGHKSNTLCLLGYIVMQLSSPLEWDISQGRFINNDEANRYLSRSQRSPYNV
ncbi:MAG: gfo/Idh/MocA family oxidoreductase [Candidatus Marinimicrobia bacterium]|nr:gfo/Idh/MocA family oxidoreductase [Candidatus Neomarinimicrobiota bacterium]